MNHEDFEIDKAFFTGSGEWVCVDKGRYFVLAVKKQHWMTFNRFCPDIDPMVFCGMDYGGCDLTDRF